MFSVEVFELLQRHSLRNFCRWLVLLKHLMEHYCYENFSVGFWNLL